MDGLDDGPAGWFDRARRRAGSRFLPSEPVVDRASPNATHRMRRVTHARNIWETSMGFSRDVEKVMIDELRFGANRVAGALCVTVDGLVVRRLVSTHKMSRKERLCRVSGASEGVLAEEASLLSINTLEKKAAMPNSWVVSLSYRRRRGAQKPCTSTTTTRMTTIARLGRMCEWFERDSARLLARRFSAFEQSRRAEEQPRDALKTHEDTTPTVRRQKTMT